ncbi:hypothetical protein MSG28_013890 [Choristoneura fumiferana]|uniref:Uncharacterized protein n=1 Tax=Choristoneura fumiferana TaxID=7141 RepID=A0ACC0K9D7_CHOFU|nr:hypothetical protein MSG28_013890 [Choristoneura fumiferana]
MNTVQSTGGHGGSMKKDSKHDVSNSEQYANGGPRWNYSGAALLAAPPSASLSMCLSRVCMWSCCYAKCSSISTGTDSFTDLGLHDKKICTRNDSFTDHGNLLRLLIRALHSRTFRPQRPSVLRAMAWPLPLQRANSLGYVVVCKGSKKEGGVGYDVSVANSYEYEHLIRHDGFFKTILEGKIEGKRGRGRPRRSYIDQIREKVGVASRGWLKGGMCGRYSTDKSITITLKLKKNKKR